MRHLSLKLCLTFTLMLAALPLLALETAPRISDREIIEALTEIKAGQKNLEDKIESVSREMRAGQKNLEDKIESVLREMDKRFEAVDKRFEAVDKRFEEVNQRFDQIMNLIIGILAAFAAITAATIGFALWDRHTMIRPFESKVAQIESQLKKQEALEVELGANRQKLHNLLEAMRVLAQTDSKIAGVLKTFSLL